MKPLLEVTHLKTEIANTPVLKGINLTINAGEFHAIMGPNGSGKSTLALSLAGHPAYTITGGTAHLSGQNMIDMSPDERARKGLFLAFQYPMAIPGVSVGNFLRKSYESIHHTVPKDFRQTLYTKLTVLNLDKSFAARSVNDGFSGGEKKRLELVQMAILEPKVVILDEIDSGLDIDGLKLVANTIKSFLSQNNAVIMITHYSRVLELVKPHQVHIMQDGVITKSGGYEVALELEKKGYAS